MTEPTSRPQQLKVSVQVGLQLVPYAEQRAAWIESERLGVDTIFNWDHFFPSLPGADADGTNLEAYTSLAAMAEVTERVQIGCLVTCNSYRNPNLIADMARTIDHISGGRFILGMGSGWMVRDYEEYGYELGTPASRLQALARDLPIIEDRLGKLNPGPVNGRMPLLIGGGGEKVTLRLVAKHADIWHGGGDVETIARKVSILDEWCAKIGRDPHIIERSVGINAQQIADLDKYVSLGVTHFTTTLGGPTYDYGLLRELLAWRDSHR
ncbi:MAG TPA: LLM class F420-dependent oxidoreductase [Thermomicrobiales bacterium]|nr:LLM class F420-dependent oxidoreductase [Thermomicrobiales bacterium]